MQQKRVPAPGHLQAGGSRIEILEAYSNLEDVRALFLEYSASLGIDLGYQNFSEELSGLPGKYAKPEGRLYLALADGSPAGCVALRRFDGERAEMKRLYVRPGFRGLHLGRLLSERVLRDAAQIGYRAVLLDTLGSMERAQQLYRRLGFVPIEPYYDSPIAGTVFLQRTLGR
ncbi:MAG: GNAT family N-acetyltransferase [Eubacteriales bacterium]|nr:GNAT family N-acetyltransferase [Eubacteriales bacterium]